MPDKIIKASVIYSKGLGLQFSKDGLSPMLFLEWLGKFRAGINWLHKVQDNANGCFVVRLNMKQDEYRDCAEYINGNLPIS